MENKLMKHTHTFISNSHPPSLSIHKDSKTISKTKPKIRIIHIFAPEIIKTDVENFRELVQKLTGKPSGEKYCKKKPREEESRSNSSGSGMSENPRMITKKMELRNGGFWGLDQTKERVKEEEGVCSDESSGGYLGGFSDLDGFISEFGEFPLLPLDGTHMQGF
ncbi:VQ motif-containing protein 17-like [Gastrolobium bilobum]|uniref:VQ motif-containing protein 17-like n=1 Tax=Gastrolobium bilobum TaxID=150636 RepID=UPI002AAF6DDF|nr:VQ motif-containing protein 17-like [Gastrolobium bilobum]